MIEPITIANSGINRPITLWILGEAVDLAKKHNQPIDVFFCNRQLWSQCHGILGRYGDSAIYAFTIPVLYSEKTPPNTIIGYEMIETGDLVKSVEILDIMQ